MRKEEVEEKEKSFSDKLWNLGWTIIALALLVKILFLDSLSSTPASTAPISTAILPAEMAEFQSKTSNENSILVFHLRYQHTGSFQFSYFKVERVIQDNPEHILDLWNRYNENPIQFVQKYFFHQGAKIDSVEKALFFEWNRPMKSI